MYLMIIITNLLGLLLLFNILSKANNYRIFKRMTVELSSYKPRVHFIDRLESRYLVQTQLDRFISFETFKHACMVWLAIVLVFVILVPMDFLLSLIMVILFMSLPFLLIEKYLKWVDIKIDQGIFELLNQINARLIKNDDVLAAIRDAQEVVKNKHVLCIVEKFNQMIKVGIPTSQAFKIIQTSIHNDYLKYVFINIEIVLSRRGNVPALMKALENEFTSIQIEVNKRKVELEYEKNMMLFSILLVALTVYKIVSDHDYILQYFQKNSAMVYLVFAFILLGVIFAASANRKSY